MFPGMELWRPPDDEPMLHEWWLPLLATSRRAREEHICWPLHVDEFALDGRIDRGPRPSIWVYVHGGSLRELLVDGDGRTYGFVPHRSGRSAGRFREIPLRHAIWGARIPDHVEPVWYDAPPQPLVDPADVLRLALDVVDDDDEDDEDDDEPEVGRHLRLVVSHSASA
jgi:hypothetical protein